MADFGALRLLTRDLNFEVHGLSATVTLPDADDSIETTAIWCVPPLEEVPLGTSFQRAQPQLILALRKDDVPEVPLKTQIVVAPIYGGTATGWKVDGFDRVEPDHTRVIVVADPDYMPEDE